MTRPDGLDQCCGTTCDARVALDYILALEAQILSPSQAKAVLTYLPTNKAPFAEIRGILNKAIDHG